MFHYHTGTYHFHFLVEAPRLCHIAVASRNHILRLFRRWREGHLVAIEAAEGAYRQAMRTNASSLAWHLRADLLPRPGAGSRWQKPINVGGDFGALADAQVSNQAQLQRQVTQLRAEAQATLASARARVNGPVTMAEWAQWFAENHETFSQSMRQATEQRRVHNRRLLPDSSLPPRPAPPPNADADNAASPAPLLSLLRRRTGWHALRTPRRMRLLFLWPYNGVTWVFDPNAPLRGRTWIFSLDAMVSGAMQPLSQFVSREMAAAPEVFEVAIQAAPSAETIEISMVDLQQVLAELRRPAAPRRQQQRLESGASSAGSSESELSAHLSVASAAVPEVETDLDEGLDGAAPGTSSGSDAEGVPTGSKKAPVAGDAAEQAAGSDEAPPHAALRHSKNTWTQFANLWWRIVSHPNANDVRINLHARLGSAGLGYGVQKQVTPRHFDEVKPLVPRCVFLLRCWSIWRVQRGSWLDDERYPYRRREFVEQVEILHQDLMDYHRGLPPGAPFLNNAAAASVARRWAPAVVDGVAAARRSSGAAGGSRATGSSGA